MVSLSLPGDRCGRRPGLSLLALGPVGWWPLGAAATLPNPQNDRVDVRSNRGERTGRKVDPTRIQLVHALAEGGRLLRLTELGSGRHDGGEETFRLQEG